MSASEAPPVNIPESAKNANSPMHALDIQGVSFQYGKTSALSDIAISIAPGESVILLGPNGAGKTTLFSLICGLFAADRGSILINGRSLLQSADALAPLGIVFQSQTLDLDLSVEQNLMYFCALQGIARKEARARIATALKRMDMSTRGNDKVRSLNGGHRRRVEIIRATLHKPSILLLDEPTVGLDSPTRSELIRYIHELPAMHGCAVLWATHLMDEVYDSDRVLMLHKGNLHLDGTPEQLLRDSHTQDLADLMQQVMAS